MSRNLGDAFINISPDATDFRPQLQAKLKAAMAGIKGEVPLAADSLKLDAAIAAAKAKVASLRVGLSDLKLSADASKLNAAIAAAEAKVIGLEASISNLQLDADDKALVAKIAALQAQAVHLQRVLTSETALEVDIRAASTKILAITAQIRALQESAQIKLDANALALLAKLGAAKAELADLQSGARTIKIDADISALTAKLAVAEGELRALTDQKGATGSGATNNLKNLGAAALLAGTGFGFLANKIPLFGGALAGIPFLGAISVFHLLVESILEIAAVVIPAAVALTAFGVAASSTVNDIIKKETALFTITTALGTAFPGLADGLQHFTDSVKPQVYVLFGEALDTINKHTGLFQQLATGAGQVLDNLGARAANALGGNGLNGLIAHGVSDLQLLGNIVGNVFGIFGNVLKVLPGYAQALFSGLQAVTGALENITGSSVVQTFLGIGLALHGAVIWGGLAASALFALRGPITGIATWAGGAIGGILALGSAFVEEAAAAGTFTAIMDTLSLVNPFVWVAVAVGALVGLVVWLGHLASASNASLGSIDDLAAHATTFSLVNQALAQGLAETNKQLSQTPKFITVTTAQLHDQTKTVTELNPQYVALAGNSKTLSSQIQTQTSRVAELNKITGSAAKTQEDLQAIGVKGLDVYKLSASAFAQLVTEVKAYATATTQLAGFQKGQAAAAQNALTNSYLQETLPAIQKITQAEDQLIQVVTGSQTAFNNFQQSIQGTTAKFVSPSGLADAAKLAHGNLSSLNEQSLAFSNTLYNISIPALQKTIGALQQQGISTRDLSTVTATGAGEMLKYIGNNKEAQSVIVALINNALGPGTVSLSTLKGWVDKNSTSLTGMNSIIAESTVKAGTLAGVLNDTLVAAFQKSLFNASGAQTAIDNMTKAIVSQGTNSNAFKNARDQLIADLEKTGLSSQDAKTYVDKLQASIDALHGKNVEVGVTISAAGKAAATALVAGEAALHSSITFQTQGAAEGGMIFGGTPGKDSVLGMLMPGEVVVPTKMVKAGAVDHLRGQLPGFAAGGAVGSLDRVSTWAAGAEADWGKKTALAWANAAEAAFQKAAAAAGSAYNGPASFGGGFESLSALTSYARYFMQNGLSAAAAAGMAATISGEQDSRGPESVGSGGFGLIGWTGNTIGLPAGYTGPTGNVAKDLAIQLAGVIGYMNARGGAGPLNAAAASGGPVAAGNEWSRYEAPQVSLSDTRPAVAQEIYAALTGAATKTGTGVPLPSTKQLAAGGLVRAYASGGLVTNLDAQQTAERGAFAAVRSAVGSGLSHPNAFFTSHKASLTSELATLTKRQASEQTAYAALAGKGMTAANLKKFATQVRDETSTSQDKYLSEAVSTKGLISALATLAATATSGSTTVAGAASATNNTTTTAAQGASEPPAGATTTARLGQQEKAEQGDFNALVSTLSASLANPTGWLKTNKTSVTNELATITKRQQAQEAAYLALAGTGLTDANLKKFGSASRAEITTSRDKGLSTASPGAIGVLAAALSTLSASAAKGVIPSVAIAMGNQSTTSTAKGTTGEGSASTSILSEAQYTKDFAAVQGLTLGEIQKSAHLTHLWHLLHLQHLADIGLAKGGMVFDSGGTLAPGANLVWNRTGKPEHLTPTDSSPPGRRTYATLDDVHTALQELIRVTGQQGTNLATALNSTSASAAYRGSYSTRR